MTDDIKREIDRLLGDGGPATGRGAELLRARLAASLSEGLGSSDRLPDADAMDPATMAAFVEGKLTGAERDRFVSALSRRPDLRADVESVAALVQSIDDHPLQPPKDLLARARRELAPLPRQAEAQTRPRWQLAMLWPRQRVAWAAVAALVLLVAAPTALMIGSFMQPHTGNMPDLSSAPSDDDTQPQSCPDKSKDTSQTEPSKSNIAEPKEAERKEAAPSTVPPPADPCATPAAPGGSAGK